MKSGILLCNLGSPKSTDLTDITAYLHEFLMDKYVIDSPAIIRKILVDWIIIPKRSKNTQEAYKKIWQKNGSPLVAITRQLSELVQSNVSAPIGMAMRYGEPSIRNTLKQLLEANPQMETLYVITLYPHYAMSSTQTAQEKIIAEAQLIKPGLSISFHPPFFDDKGYIEALYQVAKPILAQPYDHFLFSYHGLPERHLVKTDPSHTHCLSSPDCCQKPSPAHRTCYRHQTIRTTEEFVRRANIPEKRHSISYQSRLGRDPWIKPNTVDVLAQLPKKGVKKLIIMSPSFVTDCLETLEEIEMRAKETFLSAGGESFTYVPCLNIHPVWVDTVSNWCRQT